MKLKKLGELHKWFKKHDWVQVGDNTNSEKWLAPAGNMLYVTFVDEDGTWIGRENATRVVVSPCR
jgi:hypothetical protein